MYPPTQPDNLKAMILRSLRDGPKDPYQLAADVHTPVYRVRLLLRSMRREHLVDDGIADSRIVWRLTDRGWTHARSIDQLTLVAVS